MAKQNTTKAAETDAPQRKMLTAALEAQLAEAKAKAAAKENKAKTEAKEKRAKLIERRDDLNAKIAALDAVIGDETEAEKDGDVLARQVSGA